MTGRIFDIQRFSVHDGPGIRTTVFFKGCLLHCRWCHNPEGLRRDIELRFDKDKCIGCGACSYPKRQEDARICPSGAIELCGRDVSVYEIIKEVLRDRVFYEGEGGVTLSGGECLLQADFAAELLEKLKSEGIHTAIDTSGFVPYTEFEKTLPFCDLYLYDVKCADSALHCEYTGADNEPVLDNLRKLSTAEKEIWVRVPVIPGFNDSEREMTAIADIIAPLRGVSRVTLMPYHSLGAGKYRTLGLEYPFDLSKSVGSEAMSRFIKIFESRHITVL